MPYRIGEAFSPQVFESIERARDRAARGGGGRTTTTRSYGDDGLQQSYLRAAEGDKDRALRRELALQELQGDAQRYDLDRQARMGQAQIEDERRRASDASLAQYREGALDIREGEAAARAGRYAERSDYEKGVLDVRGQEAEAEQRRADLAEKESEGRDLMRRATTRQKAMDLIARLRREALAPDARDPSSGKPIVSPEKRRSYAALIQEAGRLFTHSPEAGGRGMGDDLGALSSRALRDIIGFEGEGWDEGLEELDETTGYVDMGG